MNFFDRGINNHNISVLEYKKAGKKIDDIVMTIDNNIKIEANNNDTRNNKSSFKI